MYASNEKIAHDLAVAIIAQKCINSNPTEIAYEYNDCYNDLLDSLKDLELEYLENQDIIHP